VSTKVEEFRVNLDAPIGDELVRAWRMILETASDECVRPAHWDAMTFLVGAAWGHLGARAGAAMPAMTGVGVVSPIIVRLGARASAVEFAEMSKELGAFVRRRATEHQTLAIRDELLTLAEHIETGSWRKGG
jgi:hypothetical protein